MEFVVRTAVRGTWGHALSLRRLLLVLLAAAYPCAGSIARAGRRPLRGPRRCSSHRAPSTGQTRIWPLEPLLRPRNSRRQLRPPRKPRRPIARGGRRRFISSYRGGFANEHAHPSVGGWSEGATRPRDAATVRRRPPRVAVPTPRQVTSSRCRHESARRNQPERGSDAPLQPPGPRHAHPRRRAEHRTRRERCRGCRHSCARTVVGGDHAATHTHKGVRGLHDAGKRERRRAAGPRRSRRRVHRVVARAIRDPVARARQARMATQRRGRTVRPHAHRSRTASPDVRACATAADKLVAAVSRQRERRAAARGLVFKDTTEQTRTLDRTRPSRSRPTMTRRRKKKR